MSKQSQITEAANHAFFAAFSLCLILLMGAFFLATEYRDGNTTPQIAAIAILSVSFAHSLRQLVSKALSVLTEPEILEPVNDHAAPEPKPNEQN